MPKKGRPQLDRKTNSSTNVFDVTHDLVICHHAYINLIQCLIVMKSGISITGKATTHDCAEDVGVACYRNVSAGRIKGCENIPGGIDFDCLRGTRSGGADSKKLHVTDPTRVRIISGSWRDQRRDAEAAMVGGFCTSVNILIIEVACFHLHVPGEPDFRRYAFFNGDLSGNVAVDNDLCIGVRKGGAAGVAIHYRFAAGNSRIDEPGWTTFARASCGVGPGPGVANGDADRCVRCR